MYNKILLIVLITFLLTSNLFSQKSSIYFTGGINFPGNSISEIFGNNIVNTTDTVIKSNYIVLPDVIPGYSLNLKFALILSEKAEFYGGFGMMKFLRKDIKLFSPVDNSQTGKMDVNTTIYPISAGIHYYILNNNIGIYLIGDLSYYLTNHTLNNIESKYILKLSQTTSESMLGFGIGSGFLLNLGKGSLIFELIYSNLNFVGKPKDEKVKNVLSLKAGIKF